MKTKLLIVACLFISFTGFAQFNSINLKLTTNDYSVERYTYEKLRIYPIRANDEFRNVFKDVGKFSNLEDAINKDELEVTEIDASGTVNKLFAENNSTDTVYIMAGEVVKGGKQDRIIGQDVVIAPGEKVNLAAFCVEHGRWTKGKSKGANGNDKFDGYFNVSSKEVRKAAVVDKNQGRVWEKVAETTAGNDVSSGTSTYTALGNSKEYKEVVEKYMKRFKSAWDADGKVVGVVAVSGDKVIGTDIFATHDLFVNSYNNLLHSYTTDAMTNGKEVTITNKEVQAYLDQFLADEAEQEKSLEGKGSMFKHKNRKLHLAAF